MFIKRKLYNSLKNWKNNLSSKLLIIDGAIQVGKTTLAKEFAKNEFKNYLFLDTEIEYKKLEKLCKNQEFTLGIFSTYLKNSFNVTINNEDLLLIFDNVDSDSTLLVLGLYSRIKSLNLNFKIMALRKMMPLKNTWLKKDYPDVLSLRLNPLDFEEFLMAFKEEKLIHLIKESFATLTPLKPSIHSKAMTYFKMFLLIGGMPTAVSTYIKNNDVSACEETKKEILELYKKEISKISYCYKEKVNMIFEQMPELLSSKDKRIVFKNILEGSFSEQFKSPLNWIEKTMLSNECYSTSDISNGLNINSTRTYIKCYLNDTGLLFTETVNKGLFNNEEISLDNNSLFNLNKSMLFENAVAQMLVADNHPLFFYTHYSNIKHRYDIEIEFLLEEKDNDQVKLIPIKVHPSQKNSNLSLSRFIEANKPLIKNSYFVYIGNLIQVKDITCIPPYMLMCI